MLSMHILISVPYYRMGWEYIAQMKLDPISLQHSLCYLSSVTVWLFLHHLIQYIKIAELDCCPFKLYNICTIYTRLHVLSLLLDSPDETLRLYFIAGVAGWFMAQGIRLSDWGCILWMMCVQIPSREKNNYHLEKLILTL